MPAAETQMNQFLVLVEERRADVYEALGAVDDAHKKRIVMLGVTAIRNHTHRDGPCRCSAQSMWQCLIDICRTELIPDTAEQHAYLIPYPPELTLVIGYRGMIKVAVDAGVVDHIRGEIVRQKDWRRYVGGEKPQLKHRFDPFDTKRGDIVGAYTIATLSNGIIDPETMNAEDIAAIKDAARRTGKGKLSPAWMAFETEMIKKSCFRRHLKRLQGTRRIQTGLAANRLAAALAVDNKEYDFDRDSKIVTPGATDLDMVVDDLNPPKRAEEPATETTARVVKPEPPPPPPPEPERFLDLDEQQVVEQTLAQGGWLSREWPRVLKEYAGVDSTDQIRIDKLPALLTALEQAAIQAAAKVEVDRINKASRKETQP